MIHNKFGRSWPSGLVFVSYFVLVLSIPVAFGNPILAVFLFIGATFFGFTSSGILLDPATRQYMDYTKFFGVFRQGKWESLEPWPYLTILRKNFSSTIQSAGNVTSTTNTETVFDICLLNHNHRKKMVIQRMKNYEKAKAEATILAGKLGVEESGYSPQISEATRARRR